MRCSAFTPNPSKSNLPPFKKEVVCPKKCSDFEHLKKAMAAKFALGARPEEAEGINRAVAGR
jgi:hypothetical protein